MILSRAHLVPKERSIQLTLCVFSTCTDGSEQYQSLKSIQSLILFSELHFDNEFLARMWKKSVQMKSDDPSLTKIHDIEYNIFTAP